MASLDLFGDEIVEEVEYDNKRKKLNLFKDFIPDIFKHKQNIVRNVPHAEDDYSAWMINKSLSMHRDCVMLANEININYHIPNIMVHDFYIHAIRKGFRKGWHKGTKDDDLAIVMEYYQYSFNTAKAALEILTKDDIMKIKDKMDIGGRT